ncbi:MAG: phosphoribosyl-AMP cyclohydrolase [Candidatus Altiarchaeota archaeon]|nr:phosphoribosyl-AMP cyclohydrolase [Candidatus Altiarchaeota archaeon]
MNVWDEIKTRSVDGIDGLVTVVVQDEKTNEVLMLAYANRIALEKTTETGLAHYFSTSRKKIWLKGESSGNTQNVSEILIDCDMDAVIYRVSQKGGACHKGYRTCFYRKIQDGKTVEVEEKLFNPDEIYGKK